MQNNFRLSVFKTESTVYKCHLSQWKYGGACFVCVCFVLYFFFDVVLFFWLFVFVFFSCLVQNTKYVSRYVYKWNVNSVPCNNDASLCS